MLDLTSDLSNYLAPGERVLWQGQGKRRLTSAVTGGYAFAIIFAVVGLLFAGVFLSLMTTSSRSRGVDPFMFIVPIFVIAVGLGVGLPLVLMSNRASKARYYVTNFAALIVYAPSMGTGRRVTVVPLKNLTQLALNENRDGTGTLTLAASPAAYGRTAGSWAADSIPTFANIEQPWDVYQLIRKQMTDN